MKNVVAAVLNGAPVGPPQPKPNESGGSELTPRPPPHAVVRTSVTRSNG
jgi:hypothetical protein